MHNIGDTISQQLESGVVSRYTIMRVLGQGVCGPVFQIQGPGGGLCTQDNTQASQGRGERGGLPHDAREFPQYSEPCLCD
ncbi:hypothetical protein DSO57_1032395 [Entomophthora muscae]|uniref:Uncharacterized protein n=1 Tax=Entomophthora muscae TaxID=34485 RepID=A0ACC2RRB0_9FUNG|nr:hypothetical protein DSO57_1032395 [Entomophthora muscae]